MSTSILRIEKQVGDTTEDINNKMDKIDERQIKLVDENNRLYRNIETLSRGK